MKSSLKKIVCAVSGGVDSSVAALLLKRKGYHVVGVFMRNWDIVDETGHCYADRDKEDAEYVCKTIGIPFLEVNFVKEYWNNVFSSLVHDYMNGLTPNPDILCNKKIKFDAFFKYAIQNLQADAIATGHYAKNCLSDSFDDLNCKDIRLLKAVDQNKDQTFFLSQIPRESLQRCIFPLGNLTKTSVKRIASEAGLGKIAKKKESTGICFIGRRNFQNFISDYIEPKQGNFVNIENGNVVGQHKGVHYWTVGQRCLLPGLSSAFFIAERNRNTQEILVAPGTKHPALFHLSFTMEAPFWITLSPPHSQQGVRCDFRFQHRHPLVKCNIFFKENGELEVFLDEPLKALTPGQYAAFYKDDECLGSGRILHRGPSLYAMETDKIKSNFAL